MGLNFLKTRPVIQSVLLYSVVVILKPSRKQKEDITMKTTAIRRTDFWSQPSLPHPNAATRREMIHKFLDLLIVGAVGAGLAASLLLIVAFC